MEKKTGGTHPWRNNFVFNTFLYFEPVQPSENMVRIGANSRINSELFLNLMMATENVEYPWARSSLALALKEGV